MKVQKLLSYIRRAVDDYDMIQENDVIAVGISGGKDSLTLLYGLAKLQHFYPIPFTVKAITIDVGFNNMDFSKVKDLCDQLNVEYVVHHTDISKIVFDLRKESNPCSLCSKLRKGALNEKIKEMGCNKVAYAHHLDDMVDTMMLSLIYEGRFHTFSPVTFLDNSEITLLRPMMYLREYQSTGFVKTMNLPVVKTTCPMDKHTKREEMKQLMLQIDQEHPGAINRMFTAIVDGNLPGWTKRSTRAERYEKRI